MFSAPPIVETEVYAVVPAELRAPHPNEGWSARHGNRTTCFIEGPAFDRDGNLFFVDMPFGRILKLDRERRFDVAAQYDGEPCGLAFHRDGSLYVADFKNGIVRIDTATGEASPVLTAYRSAGFKGCNDLTFAANGDLYFTDQGQTGLQDPTGRLFRLRADGRLDLLLDNVPSPNGLVINPEGTLLYLAVTRANNIWRVPLREDGQLPKVGVFVQLSGSLAGPDGLAIDEAGNLAIAHAGLGVAWLFSKIGEPVARIQSRIGLSVTNLAYGWPSREWLFLTESSTGTILRARLETPGQTLFSHL